MGHMKTHWCSIYKAWLLLKSMNFENYFSCSGYLRWFFKNTQSMSHLISLKSITTTKNNYNNNKFEKTLIQWLIQTVLTLHSMAISRDRHHWDGGYRQAGLGWDAPLRSLHRSKDRTSRNHSFMSENTTVRRPEGFLPRTACRLHHHRRFRRHRGRSKLDL